MTESRHITIFDTTLRDGEQSPGASMNLTEKLEIAQALQDLGVDVIEAGFPIASPGDFEAVREDRHADSRNATVCGLARCNEKDIDRAWEALKIAENTADSRFLATSAIHREFKLQMTREEIVQRAVEGVKRAAGYCDDVEFSPEDAARTEHDFLCQVVEAAIDAGATTVNIPDTVGYATPAHMGETINMLMNRVPNIDKAVISIHCHNDLGLAVANSLAAVRKRRRTDRVHDQRNWRTGRQLFAGRSRDGHAHAKRLLPCETRINTQRLVPTSRLVSGITGHARPTQQGHCRPQRLCPRGRHPPGRNAQGTHHLRDHAPGRCRLLPKPISFWANTVVELPWPIEPRHSGYRLTGEQLQRDLRRVQGTGRQEERNLRRRYCRADRTAIAWRQR